MGIIRERLLQVDKICSELHFDTTICFEIKKPQPEDKNEKKENVWLNKIMFSKKVKS